MFKDGKYNKKYRKKGYFACIDLLQLFNQLGIGQVYNCIVKITLYAQNTNNVLAMVYALSSRIYPNDIIIGGQWIRAQTESRSDPAKMYTSW